MPIREIIEIDEELCDGCGLCVPSCEEGALAIIDGKAKLVKEAACDGFGACIGDCPQGALKIVKREADEFDEDAVVQQSPVSCPSHEGAACPGSASRDMRLERPGNGGNQQVAAFAGLESLRSVSELGTWPIQLHLVNPQAPWLENSDLLICADCVGFALPDLHASLLRNHVVAIACPKLDNVEPYIEKLTRIFTYAKPRSVSVAIMEVPCCGGLVRIVDAARNRAGLEKEIAVHIVSVRGDRVTKRLPFKPLPQGA